MNPAREAGDSIKPGAQAYRRLTVCATAWGVSPGYAFQMYEARGRLSDVLRDLKSNSSGWMQEVFQSLESFRGNGVTLPSR
jgi:hypothetical protein